MDIANNITSGNNIVDRMLKVDLTLSGAGCFIPNTWFKSLTFDNGKPNTIACIILSEIVYWYKPQVICDERTGQITAIRKKFKSDLLQKSYAELSEKYGITKQQATNSVIFLEKLGVIERVFRTLDVCGTKISNVLFISLNIDRLVAITYPKFYTPSDTPIDSIVNTSDNGIHFKDDTSPREAEDISKSVLGSTYSNGHTNTDITTDYTPKISSSSGTCVEEDDGQTLRKIIADNIKLNELKSENPEKIERIDMLYDVIYDVVKSKAKTIRINKENIPQPDVKNEFLKIRKSEILYVLDILNEPKTESIKNLSSYIKTILYNSIRMAKEHFKQKANINFGKRTTAISQNSFNNFPQRQYTDAEWAAIENRLNIPLYKMGSDRAFVEAN